MYIPRRDWQKQLDRVRNHGQEHVLRFWDELGYTSQERLISQIASIDFELLEMLKRTHINTEGSEEDEENDKSFEPPEVIDLPETEEDILQRTKAKREGDDLLRKGKVAVFVVAGGQGSRLGFDGPKGCYRISPIKRKSLFQLHAEKLVAMSRRYGKAFPFYIMTSETNHDETKKFFEDNDYFGLDEVHFFRQDMIPAMDPDGKMILSAKDTIFMNPNGHGGSLYALKESGALDDMKSKGVEHIFYMQVDNALVNILDPVFIGHHKLNGSEMSNKAVKKAYPEEKVGVFGVVDGKNTVIEYSVLPDSLRYQKDERGELRFNAGNTAIHCIDIALIERVYEQSLPFNKAFKKIPFIDDDGNLVKPEEPNGYKFEMFIFDALSQCNKSITMIVDRRKEFAPVKNKDGNDSPETARKMISDLHKNWLKRCGIETREEATVEISPLFALDAVELRKKISTKSIDNNQEEIFIGE
ncbi:MAG: UTP--glucose-1-phosphate uridylyltransferase [Candidatus Woesearchaeota archaeon]